MLPEIWRSIFYHAELDLLLVVYVDDCKMAGPEPNLAEGCKRIGSVIDMDPPAPFGRYFGCHHFEKTGVVLPREAHPFAHVFDKKHAAAAQGNLKPQRTEIFWEVDPEVGAVIRRHIYPRKKLYSPTEADIKLYPGPPKRSKAEAKQGKFHSTETIQEKPVPCMPKPVNVMTYDMRDFLVSCVDKYCELAKVNRSSLRHVFTRFHENRIAKPTSDNELQGHL